MTTDEARKWADLYSKIAEGKKWQIESFDPAALGRQWRDANEQDDPRGWSVKHLRIKPEPQLVYVATWFDLEGKMRVASMAKREYDDPQRVLERRYGNHTGHTGFRIDIIERELP